MPWFKVDDSFPQHKKVLAIPRRDRTAAIGLWTLAGGWCASQLTDGHLGAHLISEFASSKKYAEILCEVGLWERTDSGYVFHNWSRWQPTREQVEADRAAARERMKKARSRRSSPEQPPNNGVSSPAVAVTPSRPDPTSSSYGTTEDPRKRGARIPDPFVIDDAMKGWCREKGYDPAYVLAETEKFVNYWQAKSGKDATKLDWPATWRNWLIKGAENHRPANGTADDHHSRYMARLAQQEAGR